MSDVYGFELVREREIAELNTRARLFRHIQMGAELLSLENSDENKVFGITFRTPPSDSTGLPHIMEHSVLCGSQKYPVKEPFVELMKGSLKTFLNAFTYPDKTCYPVASQNVQDFYNLVDVYVDAVLHPLIPPQTLKQEGWHYELEDPEGPLTYKGVVYNEMKGAYSSPENLFARHIQQSLFPQNTYGVDSGGDPAVIPNLTYEQFKNFHETFYHPTNARIFFYGDDDPEERLRRMDAYLRQYDAIDVDSAVALQPAFREPKTLVLPYAVDEESDQKKTMVAVNWLLPETTDPELPLAFQILAHILIGTPASPLRKALIDSGLGEDLAGVGLENELRQTFFSSGLKGIAAGDAGQVEALILDTLAGLVQNGIDPEMIAASVNTIEFRLRENNAGAFPRGLVLMLRALTTWLYGGDPLAPLAFEAPLRSIKDALDAGKPYFENLIRQHLLGNPHRTTVVLEPDAKLRQRQEAAERERLARVRAALDGDAVQTLIAETQELKKRQEMPDPPEALAAIPSLMLEDLDQEIKRIPLERIEQDGTQVLYHDLFTNGIVYLDLGFNLHALPQDLLPFVPLFGKALTGLGTDREDFVRLSQRIGRHTGGIHPAVFTSAIRSENQGAAWLFLRGKATTEKAEALLEILRDVLLRVRLDNPERFRQMVYEEKAGIEAALIPAGHRYVNSRLRALFTEADWASEQMSGISYLFFLRRLMGDVDRNWPGVLEKLERIRTILLNKRSMVVNATVDAESWNEFQPLLSGLQADLPSAEVQLVQWQPDSPARREALSIPAQVNYVGQGADLYQLGYELDGSVAVINNFLQTTWLWDRIRVQGGAYGGFSLFDHRSGVWTFLSYRDPNLFETLEVYGKTGQYLRQLELSPDELTKSIIGVIGDLDAYQLPDAKGYTSMVRYLVGDNDEFRQAFRDQVLTTTPQDFHVLGGVLRSFEDQGAVVVMGSQEALQAANAERDAGLDLKKVL